MTRHRHPALQEMRGVGVPQRVDGGLLGEATLAHHELEGLLEGGRRERRRLVSGGEQPGPGVLRAASRPATAPGSVWPRAQAVFTPLALSNPDQHPVGVDVRDLEMGPFPQAQSTGIDHPQTHRGFRVATEASRERTSRGLNTTGSFWLCRGRMRSKTGHGRCRVPHKKTGSHRGGYGRYSPRPSCH